MNLFIRTAVAPKSVISAVRKEISAIDPDQPVTNVQTVEDVMNGSRTRPRVTMIVLGAFAAIAVALASLGLYGVLVYSVIERRHELGIRLAIGAERSQILRLVIGHGLAVTGAGIAIGLTAALALSPVIAASLYEVDARDVTTFVLTPIAFIAIALLATYPPARRATRVDPADVLRHP
jgi:putative ABC transport system permease protein